MIYQFRICAEGSELDGETFEVQDTDAFNAGVRASYHVQDTFSMAPRARRLAARAVFVANYPSRRAMDEAEEGPSIAKAKRGEPVRGAA